MSSVGVGSWSCEEDGVGIVFQILGRTSLLESRIPRILGVEDDREGLLFVHHVVEAGRRYILWVSDICRDFTSQAEQFYRSNLGRLRNGQAALVRDRNDQMMLSRCHLIGWWFRAALVEKIRLVLELVGYNFVCFVIGYVKEIGRFIRNELVGKVIGVCVKVGCRDAILRVGFEYSCLRRFGGRHQQDSKR